MEFSLLIQGTPADFAAVVVSVEGRIKDRLAFSAIFDGPLSGDTSMFWTDFGPKFKSTITATRTGNGKTMLDVFAEDASWPETEPDWLMLQAELVRLGYLLVSAPADDAKRPEPPTKPTKTGKNSLDAWFRWYHAMQQGGFKVKLAEVADGAGYALQTVKDQHALWKQDKDDDQK